MSGTNMDMEIYIIGINIVHQCTPVSECIVEPQGGKPGNSNFEKGKGKIK